MSKRDLPDPDEEVTKINGLVAAILGTAEVTLFENLYIAYAGEARGIARSILGDSELAADAVHNGFLEMLRYLVAGRRWLGPAEARGMALRNVRWAALSARRTRVRAQRLLERAPLPEGDDAAWARAEAHALCEEIVGDLRANHRAALRLRYIHGLSNAEAASRLGITVGVFESRLQRALTAARRVARASGFLPQVTVLVDVVRRSAGRLVASSGRRNRVGSTLGAVMRASVAGVAVALATSAVLGVAANKGAPWSAAPPHLASSATSVSQTDSIDDAVVLDAIALPSGEVLAMGHGRSCGCLLVFRSRDGGVSWNSEPGPPAPSDRWVSTVAPDTPASRALPCGGLKSAAYCPGTSPEAAGLVIELQGGRLLFFHSTGGAYCSTDGGRSWSPRCPAGKP